MAREREVGTLWIGGALSWLEQLCLKSFVDQGQKITLFSYEDIPNVPAGVIRRDVREVLDTDNFIKYEKKDSFALFADQFRLHMIHRCPGMIWVDTDVYCHRPMAYDSDYVMGFELPGQHRVNNAVLGMPADSPLMAALLEFTSDPFAIPPFLSAAQVNTYRAAAAKGDPVHVSQQPWGVWGPLMITHFVHALGLQREVMPLEAFYPVTFPDRMTFMRRASLAAAKITPQTTALHLWASNKREMGLRHNGLAPKGSYLDQLLIKHDVRPEAAPIAGRGRLVFDAGLVGRVDLEAVGVFADLGGTGQGLALAAWARWGCKIALVDLDHRGGFCPEPSGWLAPYHAFLAENGVPDAAVAVVRSAAELPKADLIANLSGFGDVNKIKGIAPVLDALLHSRSQMILDIRTGSGGYPFLRRYGTCETLSKREVDGVEVTRALFRAGGHMGSAAVVGPVLAVAASAMPHAASADLEATVPPAASADLKVTGPPAASADLKVTVPPAASAPGNDVGGWAEVARGLAGADGFYRDSAEHSMLYMPRGDTLVVTFDNLDIAMTKREDRRPWGFSFIEKQGWSMLGVMANGWTWYRDRWVSDQFDQLAASGFFEGFSRVVFYGASMGGYAACAFVAACPGADVVAISPQSTLDRRLVPFETRYKTAWGRDFSGPYGDAAEASKAAGRVTILYDPYEPLDAAHVARFTGANVVPLRAPLMGHRLGSSLHQMGILSAVTLGALNGTLTEGEFYRALKARKSFVRYQRELFKRALAKGHPALARKLGRFVLTRGTNRYIRQAMEAM